MSTPEVPQNRDLPETNRAEPIQPELLARLGNAASEGQLNSDAQVEPAPETAAVPAESPIPEKPRKFTAAQQAELDAKIRAGLGSRRGPRQRKVIDQPRPTRRTRR